MKTELELKRGFVGRSAGLFLTLAASGLSAVLLILLLSREPGQALYYFFIGPFEGKYNFGNLLNSAVFYILSGIAMSLAFRAGLFNLGGEGQLYAGAFVSAALARFIPPEAGAAGILILILAGGLAAGLAAAVSGVLKVVFNTDELLSSFLVSAILVFNIDYLVSGPLRDKGGNLLATEQLPESFRFALLLPPSMLNTSFVFMLAAAVLVFVFLFFSKPGFRLRISGLNRNFALTSGYSVGRIIIFSMFLSGFIMGLAGSFMTAGSYGRCIAGFTGGMGFSGIAVALLAGNNPLYAVFAGFLFACFDSGAKLAMLNSDLSAEISYIIQALIFLLITARRLWLIKPAVPAFLKRRRRRNAV